MDIQEREAESKLYLPVDAEGPSVETEKKRSDSLYNTVKDIIRIRHTEKSLAADAELEIILNGGKKPFVYRRGDLIIIVNPSDTGIIASYDLYHDKETGTFKSNDISKKLIELRLDKMQKIYEIGDIELSEDHLNIAPQSFIILKKK